MWTRKILSLFLEHQVPTMILTKGGKRCLRDLDLFKQFDRIKVGASLTFANFLDSKQWEFHAAPPIERLMMLNKLHAAEIPTFASFEPVIRPDQTIALMEIASEDVDEYKIGKLNHHKILESAIDWVAFGGEADQLIRRASLANMEYDRVDWDAIQGKDLEYTEWLEKLERQTGKTFTEDEYMADIRAQADAFEVMHKEIEQEVDESLGETSLDIRRPEIQRRAIHPLSVQGILREEGDRLH